MLENLILLIPKVRQTKENLETMRVQIKNMQFFNEKLREKISNLEKINLDLEFKLKKRNFSASIRRNSLFNHCFTIGLSTIKGLQTQMGECQTC